MKIFRVLKKQQEKLSKLDMKQLLIYLAIYGLFATFLIGFLIGFLVG